MTFERKLIIITAIIGVLAVSSSLILYSVFWSSRENHVVNIEKINQGIKIQGTVQKIDVEPMFVDGDGIITIKSEKDGVLMSVSIPAGFSLCAKKYVNIFNEIIVGDKVEVFGKLIGKKQIDICGLSSPSFYIKLLNDDSICVKEGEYVDHPSKDSYTCCSDLSKASALPLDDSCEVIVPENSPGIEPGWTCINCGDGVCNNKANESICNCPKDCSSDCTKQGENRNQSDPDCCPGLVERGHIGIYGGDDCLPLPNIGVSLLVCIPCGDGICNSELENKCNCTEDCENNITKVDELTAEQDKMIPDLVNNKSGLIYQLESSWGPCPNPDGGCWQDEYLYLDGKYEMITKSGTTTKQLSAASMEQIIEYINTTDLLTKPCEHSPVLDLYKTYTLSLDGKENRIKFPGCEEELERLDDLILSTSDGISKIDCEAGGGYWNSCGSPCALWSKVAPIECAHECVVLCECGDTQSYTCPEDFLCNKPEGLKDARGYCEFRG